MKNRRDFVVKTIVIMLIMLAVIFTVGFFLIRQANDSIYNSVKLSNEDALKKSIGNIRNYIDDNLASARSDGADVTYQYAAQYAAADEERLAGLTIDGTFHPLAMQNRAKLLDYDLYFTKFGDLLASNTAENAALAADPALYVVFSGTDETGARNSYFVTYATFVEECNDAMFDCYALFMGTTVVVSSNSGILDPGTPMRPAEDKDYTGSEEPVSTKAEIGGLTYLLSTQMLGYAAPDGLGYYYVGLTDFTKPQSAIDAYMRNAVIILSFCIVAILAICVVYGVLVLHSRRHTLQSADAQNYMLKTTPDGTILKANEDYERDFSEQNVAASVAVGAFRDNFTEGEKFLSLMNDHKLTRRVIKYTVSHVAYKKGKPVEYLCFGRDVTEESRTFAEIYVARTRNEVVPLQGVYDKLVWANKRILIGRVQICALKKIEMMFGKSFADQVYAAILEKLKPHFDYLFEEQDGVIGALKKDNDLDACMNALEDYLGACNQPVAIGDNLVNAEVKAGFALVEKGSGKSDYAYAAGCVAAALNKAIDDERKQFFVYHEYQKKYYAKYMEAEFDVKKLLAEDAFEMQFQPQYSLKRKKISGFEALLRFKKMAGDVNIFQFIRYAERTGNMILLGDFIFNNSMRFAKAVEGKGIVVSVNVSPVQLMQVGFVENLLKIYKSYDLKPGSVCVEITESFLMTTFEETVMKLDILRGNGIGVHLDDFGTTYSSLMYLQKLPLTAIKIDKGFIDHIGDDDYNRVIAKMVADICTQLGLESIAEGVETEEQKKALEKMGCDTIQGWLIGKSMPEKEAIALI